MTTAAQFLTPEQVFSLNEKHGWFQSGDAQSDVSKAFTQDAIAMHERMRSVAPQMLAALNEISLMWHAETIAFPAPEPLTTFAFDQLMERVEKLTFPFRVPA